MTLAYLSFALALWLGLSQSAMAEDSHLSPPPSQQWIQLPWEIRYILFVDGLGIMPGRIRRAKQHNAEASKAESKHTYLLADELFTPARKMVVPGAGEVSMFFIAFDSGARLQTSNKLLNRLSARRNVLDDLVAVDHHQDAAKSYYLADWSQGIPGGVSFSPAVCRLWDADRYSDNWDVNSDFGSFGCREWTAQLYDNDNPYIDVTSYSPHGNFIGDFVGWSRFSDPPKPVIGMQGKTWLCLHDCPHGEKPGIIRDVQAWTAKHHFPLPRRPAQQPEFPDSKYKDDLREEFQD